jgi:tRNA modification GTPase
VAHPNIQPPPDRAASGAAGLPAASEFAGTAVWLVQNKVDILGSSFQRLTGDKNESGLQLNQGKFYVSALTGQGMNELIDALAGYAGRYFGPEPSIVSRERHRKALQDAKDALERASSNTHQRAEDLIAEDLRLAARALGRLTGRVDVEDILDVIFRDFCIGK